MITSLTNLLLVISNSLLMPVILGLLALFTWTLLLTGGFIAEAFSRRKVRTALASGLAAARDSAAPAAILHALSQAGTGLPSRFANLAQAHVANGTEMNQALAPLEHDIADSVARHTFITRVSPMLGLMGTLIPLGPALSGLSSGNMAALSGNLVVAFTATVVGLLVSGVAYGVGLARRTWYSRDLTDLEFLAKQIVGETA